MSSGWQGIRHAWRPVEMRSAVATYRAIVGLDVERSEFDVSTDLDREVVEAALLQRPEWCPIPWPRVGVPTEHDLRRLALLKLGLFFDFAAELPGSTGQEIRESLQHRFPGLRAAMAGESGGVRFKRFHVEASVWSDGTASGGYQQPEDGAHPPIGTPTGAAIDLFIKNVTRADIRDRLGAEEPWQPSF